ncbi:hypothetical protein SCAR479_12821 [Seiridium cardinale]
MYYPIN